MVINISVLAPYELVLYLFWTSRLFSKQQQSPLDWESLDLVSCLVLVLLVLGSLGSLGVNIFSCLDIDYPKAQP